MKRQYIAIDLKSFYASVECVERGLDALDTCLVVADESRTDKTICLAVSPALKAYGTGGRPRLFEVVQKIRHENWKRGRNGRLRGVSVSGKELEADPSLAVGYIVAPPRMALYVDYSTRVYSVYLRFVAPEDIHVYSIDEVFIDATSYLPIYGMTAHELAMAMIRAVLAETGVTATAGIGTNMYLCKVAMDIVAKRMPPDSDGVRIAELDEMSYRRSLWEHEPITDFWRVGSGIARRLLSYGMRTMGDVARCSVRNEDLLYRLFGVNAELLIDHAWGWEPVTMDLVKSYRPETHSISSGQVLPTPYEGIMARTVVLEMADAVALELVEKRLVADQITLDVGYDAESLTNPEISALYKGPVRLNHYGKPVPAHGHGTVNLAGACSSGREIRAAVAALFDRVTDMRLLVRHVTLSFNHVTAENAPRRREEAVQLDLFTDYDALRQEEEERRRERRRERSEQEAVLRIRKMFGKNAILTGLNYSHGATQRDRNSQIGGHKA